jgi:esterase/lipase superfamily enzyme
MLTQFLFLRALLGHVHLLHEFLRDQWPYFREQMLNLLGELEAEPNDNELVARANRIYELLEGTPAEGWVRKLFDHVARQAQKIQSGDSDMDTRDPATGAPFVAPYRVPIVSAKEFKSAASDLDSAICFVGRHGVTARPPDDHLQPSPSQEQGFKVVTIHYATDRKRSGDRLPSRFFTGERAGNFDMSYGTCDVSIPAVHKKGHLERPNRWKFEFKEDAQKHVTLLKMWSLDRMAFFASAGRGGKEAFVFVHGFANTFEEAARRTAQIANDLPFEGVPILFSWPSVGSALPLAYTADEATVEWSIPHLRMFLTDLVSESHFTKVHVIAHSMGNRAVTRALHDLWLQGATPATFHQIVLSAPDIDAATFEDLARDFMPVAERVTLYASANDEAMKASKVVHCKRLVNRGPGAVLGMISRN